MQQNDGMKVARRLIRRCFHFAGLDVRRLTPQTNPIFQIVKGLEQFDVDLVFDVGANIGQFASNLRSFGYRGEIVSFEPISSAHEKLCLTAARDRRWTVFDRCAIGATDSKVDINVSENSVSSSILPMMERHSSAAPGSAYVGCESVPSFRLDSVAPSYLSNSAHPFLKIDTQGFEWNVLDGAMKTLPRFAGILCEVSIVPLYAGQPLWLDVFTRLEEEGFTLWSLQHGFTDPRDGRTLQMDASFFRL